MNLFFYRTFFGLELGVAYPLSVTFYLICLILIFNDDILKNLQRVRHTIYEFVFLFLVFASLISLLEPFVGGQNTNISMVVTSAIYARLIKAHKDIMKWTMLSVFFSTYLLIIVMSGTIAEQLRAYDIQWVGTIKTFDLTCVVFIIVQSLMIWFLKNFNIKEFKYLPKQYSLLIILVALMGIFVFFVLSMSSISPIFLFLIAIVFWVIELLSYILFYIVTREYDEKMELTFMQHKARIEREQFDFTMKSYEEMRMLKHELKNYFSYGNTLLSQKRYDDLGKLFENLNVNKIGNIQFIDCGNNIINNVMNIMYNRGYIDGIEIKSKILVPSELNIRDSEVYSLLGNLMENAIEACHSIENAQIEVHIKTGMNCLFIKVTNPILHEVTIKKGIIETSKPDKKLHGYGTKIIEIIVNKYDGYIKYNCKDNTFEADVMLNMANNYPQKGYDHTIDEKKEENRRYILDESQSNSNK